MTQKPSLSLILTFQGDSNFPNNELITVTHQSLAEYYFETLTIKSNGSIKELLSAALEATQSPWLVFVDKFTDIHSQFLERTLSVVNHSPVECEIFFGTIEAVIPEDSPRWLCKSHVTPRGYEIDIPPQFLSNIVFSREALNYFIGNLKYGAGSPKLIQEIEFQQRLSAYFAHHSLPKEARFLKAWRQVPKSEAKKLFLLKQSFLEGFLGSRIRKFIARPNTMFYLFWPCRGPRKFSFQLRAWYLIGQCLGRIITL
jgi:hypothetical protein